MNQFIKRWKMAKVMAKCRLTKSGLSDALVKSPGAPQHTSTGASPKVAAGSAATSKPTGNSRSFPVGTIHNGRRKVSDNPSKWVDVHTGDSYDDHKSPEKHETRTKDTKQAVDGFMDKVKGKLHPADVAGVEEKLHKFVEAKLKVHNLMQAANRNSSDSDSSNFSVMSKQVHKKQDEVAKLKADFVSAVKASIQRKKEHGV